ncbi:hypothetical protein ABTD90_21340, partial [Acinetobacter baumannii]
MFLSLISPHEKISALLDNTPKYTLNIPGETTEKMSLRDYLSTYPKVFKKQERAAVRQKLIAQYFPHATSETKK